MTRWRAAALCYVVSAALLLTAWVLGGFSPFRLAATIGLALAVVYTWAFHADAVDRAERDQRREPPPDGLSARDRLSLPPNLEQADPWTRYPLAPEDWALMEAAGWQVAEHRGQFQRLNAVAQVRWWEEPAVTTLDRWEPVRSGWAWSCSAGDGSGHGFPDENAAMLSAEAHLQRDH